MKISAKELRSIIKESLRALVEEKEAELPQREASLDAQVDKYLIDYEKEAAAIKKEGKDYRLFTRNFFSKMLTEAEDEEDKEEKDSTESEDAEKLTIDDIDLDAFATSVVRLVDNYDALLDVQETIARRASNYLLKNYDKSVVDQFNLILEEQHDIFVNEPEPVDDSDEYSAPTADRAGPGLSGG